MPRHGKAPFRGSTRSSPASPETGLERLPVSRRAVRRRASSSGDCVPSFVPLCAGLIVPARFVRVGTETRDVMRKPLFLFTALTITAMPCSAAVEDVTELDPVVVTATRTAQTADETLASVTVVTREEIERMQARSVSDALRGIPGLAISNSGGRGQPTTFFLRGSDSDHVLVLVDGVKIGSPTLGPAPFQDLPIDQIDRIEVSRTRKINGFFRLFDSNF